MEISEIKLKYINKFRRLYISAFPKNERMPFISMLLSHKKGRLKMLFIEDNNEFIGLVVMTEYKNKALLTFFAVSEKKRKRGYGSQTLKMLMKRYEKSIFFLEIESTKKKCVDIENRLKRKSFYLKNGMHETKLMIDLFGVEMEILTSGAEIDYEDYIKPYEMNFGKWVRDKITEI